MNSYKLGSKDQKENKETIPPTMATNKNKMFLRRQNIYTHKTLRYSWKNSKMTKTDGVVYNVFGLEELILWEWPYYSKQSTDWMQYL